MKFVGGGIDKVLKSGPMNRVVKFVIGRNKIKCHLHLLLYLLPYRLKLRAIYIALNKTLSSETLSFFKSWIC